MQMLPFLLPTLRKPHKNEERTNTVRVDPLPHFQLLKRSTREVKSILQALSNRRLFRGPGAPAGRRAHHLGDPFLSFRRAKFSLLKMSWLIQVIFVQDGETHELMMGHRTQVPSLICGVLWAGQLNRTTKRLSIYKSALSQHPYQL